MFTRAGNHVIIVTSSVSKKLRFQNVLRPQQKESRPFQIPPVGVFKKLRFRDGLEWTVVLTLEIKLRFQVSTL